MKVKASLHLHAREDFKDGKKIAYSFFQLIDRAQELNFKVLAFTGHEKMVCLPEHLEYGKERGILVIPGVEALVDGKHILILNCDQSADKIKSFKGLEEYRNNHPEIFIIAPHPNHGFLVSLGLGKLQKHRYLFDAVEHSWYYSNFFNPNRAVIKKALKLDLPILATADLHYLGYLATDYLEVEVPHLTTVDFFQAIRLGKYKNITVPKTLWEMFFYQLKFIFGDYFFRFRK